MRRELLGAQRRADPGLADPNGQSAPRSSSLRFTLSHPLVLSGTTNFVKASSQPDLKVDMLRRVVAHKKPTGPQYPIDAAWKRRLQAALDEKYGNASELAREISCTPANISHILKPATKNTSLKPRIHKALGWSMEGMAVIGHAWADEAVDALAALPDEEREAFIALLRTRKP